MIRYQMKTASAASATASCARLKPGRSWRRWSGGIQLGGRQSGSKKIGTVYYVDVCNVLLIVHPDYLGSCLQPSEYIYSVRGFYLFQCL